MSDSLIHTYTACPMSDSLYIACIQRTSLQNENKKVIILHILNTEVAFEILCGDGSKKKPVLYIQYVCWTLSTVFGDFRPTVSGSGSAYFIKYKYLYSSDGDSCIR